MASANRSTSTSRLACSSGHDGGDIDRYFGPKPKVGAFHSLSATTVLHHDPLGAGFAALVLFDPTVYPPSDDMLDVDKRWQRLAAGTWKRRERFETCEELAESIGRASVYERLLPGVPEHRYRAGSSQVLARQCCVPRVVPL